MSAETFRLFLMIFNVCLGVCSGVIVFYLYSLRGDLRALTQDNRQIREDLHGLEKGLPKEYVMREDYIRTMAAFQLKLDKTYELVSKLKKETSDV